MSNQDSAAWTKLTPGKSGTASVTVTEQNTAQAVCSGALQVFATPMMIALMEKAACEALADVLDDGQTSVGVFISASHTAASPIGAQITAEATVVSVNGKRVEFDVSASSGSISIGGGKHTRVIIDSEKFMKKVRVAN